MAMTSVKTEMTSTKGFCVQVVDLVESEGKAKRARDLRLRQGEGLSVMKRIDLSANDVYHQNRRSPPSPPSVKLAVRFHLRRLRVRPTFSPDYTGK